MIGVRNTGRMGNQMFQFAFAYSKAKIHSTTPFIDEWDRLKYFKAYKQLKFVNLLNRFYLAYLLMRRKMNIIPLEKYPGFEPKLLEDFSNNFLHIGYFQTALYFQDVESEIKNLFQVRKPFKVTLPSDPYLAIHLRFGDYKKVRLRGGKESACLDKDYFQRALRRVQTPYDRIIAVSDEPELIKEYLGLERIEVYNGNEIQDFQILQGAESLIISNSTFSWWAAYLSRDCKQIIAPKYWLGQNGDPYPKDIFSGLSWELI